ncbi:MAG: hypothetical protein Q7K55_02075 [Candidatus Levybacteria bacterium]|nr:hypothetical protein [Candidatus Levybacteria bacterium]
MKKLVFGFAILLIIIVGGVGGFYVMKKSAQKVATNQTTPVPTQKPAENKATTMQGTLKSLLSGGKSVRCAVSNKIKDVSMDGTVYVADGKMRGDFKSIASQTTVNGHVIVDSQYSYMWTDISNQGIKIAITEQPATPSAENKSIDINQTFNYSCSDWSKDNSLLTLPSNITFQTMTIPSGIPTGSTSSPASGSGGNSTNPCELCGKIPQGPSRDACKTQFKCQ